MGKNTCHLRGGEGGKKEKKAVALFTPWLYGAKFPLIARLKEQPYVAFLRVANIKIFSLEALRPWDLDAAQVSCSALLCAAAFRGALPLLLPEGGILAAGCDARE